MRGIQFFTEIIKDSFHDIPKENHNEFLNETSNLVEKSWGKFPEDYLENSILHFRYLMLLRNKKDKLIGVAPIKKFVLMIEMFIPSV